MPITGEFYEEVERRNERTCKETAVASEKAAESIARKMEARYGKPYTHYLCPKCGDYHIGKVNPKWNRTEEVA